MFIINTMRYDFLDITTVQAINNEISALESWLNKSSLFLEDLSEDNITDDVERMEHKLEQIRFFSQEMDKTNPQIETLRASANRIFEKSEPNFANSLNSKLETIGYKWIALGNEAKSLNDKFEGALKKNDDVSTGILSK